MGRRVIGAESTYGGDLHEAVVHGDADGPLDSPVFLQQVEVVEDVHGTLLQQVTHVSELTGLVGVDIKTSGVELDLVEALDRLQLGCLQLVEGELVQRCFFRSKQEASTDDVDDEEDELEDFQLVNHKMPDLMCVRFRFLFAFLHPSNFFNAHNAILWPFKHSSELHVYKQCVTFENIYFESHKCSKKAKESAAACMIEESKSNAFLSMTSLDLLKIQNGDMFEGMNGGKSESESAGGLVNGVVEETVVEGHELVGEEFDGLLRHHPPHHAPHTRHLTPAEATTVRVERL